MIDKHGEDQGNPKEEWERSDLGAEDQSSSPQGRREEEALITHPPPSPAQEAPPETGEIMRRITEAEQLEGVGRSLSLSLTQQLAQMAAEVGPSKLGREELASRKLCPTMGGKAPRRGSYRPAR